MFYINDIFVLNLSYYYKRATMSENEEHFTPNS